MSDAERLLLAVVLFIFVMVLPLVGYLIRRGVRGGHIVLSIFAIWLIWNLVNAPIHESAHWLAGSLLGLHAKDFQLIQHFWEGDFVRGYILWDNPSPRPLLVSTSAAYLADGLLILLGFVLLQRHHFKPFTVALILAFTSLRSVFDVLMNYLADTVFGGRGDFRHLLGGYPRPLVHLGAWLLILGGVTAAVHEILRLRRTLPLESPALRHNLASVGKD